MKREAFWRRLGFLGALLMSAALVFTACGSAESEPAPSGSGPTPDLKPVIYLYPETQTDVTVQLHYNGTLTYSYPQYSEGGWQVSASPDGTLLHEGREYSYLFWEGESDVQYDFSRGFVVKGEDTEAFLLQKLEYLGLLPHEYNEFLVFWLPRMTQNPYNLITFQTEAYTENAPLHITPTPDSIQRVFMAYRPLAEPMDIEEQTLTPFTRHGFSVIEWGGAEVAA